MEDRSEKFVSTHGRRRDPPGPFQARSDSFSSELNPCLIQSSKAKYFFWCLERKICHLSNSFCQGNTSSGDEVFSVSEGLRHPLLERFMSFCSHLFALSLVSVPGCLQYHGLMFNWQQEGTRTAWNSCISKIFVSLQLGEIDCFYIIDASFISPSN